MSESRLWRRSLRPGLRALTVGALVGIVTRRYRFGTTRDRRLSACWQARELISLVTTEAVVDTGGMSDHHGVVVEIDLAARVLFEDGLDP